MIPQMANMPRWMARALTDAHPSQAFNTVMATGTMRGEPFIGELRKAESKRLRAKGVQVDTSDLNSLLSIPKGMFEGGSYEAFSATMEAYSRWLHSGSPLIQLDRKSHEALDQLVTPRFHALTRMEGEGRTYLVDFVDGVSGATVDFLIQTTPEGPRVGTFSQARDESESNYHKLFSGPWDVLRWHAREWEDYYPEGIWSSLVASLRIALNAVAAIEESREILRRAPAAKKSKRKRGRDRGRSRVPKPLVYWLEKNALDAWVEKTVRRDRPSSGGSRGPHERTGTRRLHNCREHYRRTWVLQPREGEAVIEVGEGRARKDGSRATLYRVMRRVQAHARGTDVRPQALQVKGVG